ncbi:Uncharacterised protein [Vibrio cholerae]|nr:Uncharacterised protein [Vibrio cholerae]
MSVYASDTRSKGDQRLGQSPCPTCGPLHRGSATQSHDNQSARRQCIPADVLVWRPRYLESWPEYRRALGTEHHR